MTKAELAESAKVQTRAALLERLVGTLAESLVLTVEERVILRGAALALARIDERLYLLIYDEVTL